MRKCTSRYFLSLGLISIGSVLVLFLRVQWAEYSARQNTDNYSNMTVQISQTQPPVVSERLEKSEVRCRGLTPLPSVSEVSEVSEEKIFESLMRERREVMRAACHKMGLDKKVKDDQLHRTRVEHCNGPRFRCCLRQSFYVIKTQLMVFYLH